MTQTHPEPIAVVGTGCRFPGDIRTPSQLWETICSRKDILTQIPNSRFNPKGFYHSNGERHGSTNVDHAYLLSEDISAFDATFFGINPREAEAIDPQQRLLLETVYEAVDDAGLTVTAMKGSDTSVYVGLMTGDYHELQVRDPENMPMYMATGTARSIVSNRISYFYDWKGPSMTIDTACSSSLVALHHAVQSLRTGESSIAVAAGANLILGPEMMIAEANLHMLSPTARSRMWDASADGYARGEGFAAVILKTLSQALADGDPVEYIIRETGVNQDGRTQGITMPSAESQTALIKRVYERAGLDYTNPQDRPQFFEAHGTGTPRGDPLEARAISDAFFGQSQSSEEAMYVGSVKTVIGHLEGCAGLAGLLKAAEAVRRAAIPPNMHYTEMNPDIVPYSRNLQVPTKMLEWPDVQGSVRRASVNSFGFGGTNAHVILESYASQEQPVSIPSALPLPLVFSAGSEASLAGLVESYTKFLRSDEVDIMDIAATLSSRRSQHPVRATFSGVSKEKLQQELEGAISASSTIGERKQPSSHPRILGVFTGQGAQWAQMGRELILTSPLAKETINRLQESLDSLPDGPAWTIENELTNPADPARIQEAALSQPLCTAVQIMLVDLLRSAKITFHTVVGHSSGEIGAAYAAGMLSARDAMRIAYYRGVYAHLARGTTGDGKGAMMAVGIGITDAREFIEENNFTGRIGVAASNAPKSVTLAGDEDAITEAKMIFEKEETFCRLLKVDTAYHSHHMKPCLEPYCDALQRAGITPLKPSSGCTWISSVHGREMTTGLEEDPLKVNYWRDNMANTVLFSQAVHGAIQHGPFDLGLEVGPHPALKGPVTQTIKENSSQAIPYTGSLARFGNDIEALSNALGTVWKELGSDAVDFRAYATSAFNISLKSRPTKGLPLYHWDHSQKYWKESRLSRRYRQRHSIRSDLLGVRCQDDHDREMRWRNTIRVSETPWLAGHKVQGQIIFPAAGYLVMAMEAAREMAGGDGRIAMLHLRDVYIDRAIALSEDEGVEVVFHLQPEPSADTNTIQAAFSCYSAPTQDVDSRWQRNVSGVIEVHLSGSDHRSLPPRDDSVVSLASVKMDSFYESLSDIGLQYTDLFQGLTRVDRRAHRAIGYARDIEDQPEGPVMIHPAILDASFQTIFAAFCWPGDGSLQGPYVPTHLRSLRIVPMDRKAGHAEELTIDCSITESIAQSVTADVDINTATAPRIQLEGLTCTLLDPPSPANDCELFAQTVWQPDAGTGLSAAALRLPADEPNDLELVDICERLSYSYLRNLNATIDRNEVPSFIWHHQRIFEFIDYLFPLIESGQHPTIRAEWQRDSHEWLLSQAQRYPDNVDLQLISAVGEHLADVVRGETTMLEHMVVNDTLNRFYKYGLGFQRANGALSRAAKGIAHRYPRMRILEIGAGTGGATKGVLEHLGDAFDEYVFTDISAGFFEKAREQFAPWADRMTFRALNVEEDIAAQGMQDGEFDLVIASNVLHATKCLDDTMRNVRRLTKPGGYLLLLEVTSDILRVKLMMAGLSGWWLGADDGRRYAPTITAPQWNDLLIRTGFSGVDQQVTDFQDASKHMTSVMLSQAVTEDVTLLREPLAVAPETAVERVVLVGGQTSAVYTLAQDVAPLVKGWSTQSPAIITSLDEVARMDISLSTVLFLADLDGPVIWGTTNEQLAALQQLLNQCRQLLWITAGGRSSNPYANMSIGLGRSLMYEYPHIRMQFLDLPDQWNDQATQVASAMARLILADKMDLPSQQLLWSVEPEIAIEDGRCMIPRILPNNKLNRRLNARKRVITEDVDAESPVQVVGDGHSLWLEKATVSPTPGQVLIRPEYALMHAMVRPGSAPMYLSSGVVDHGSSGLLPGGAHVLALTAELGSLIPVSSSQIVAVDSTTPAHLRLVALALATNSALKTIRPWGHVLLVEPSPETRHLVETRARTRGVSVTVVSFSPGNEDSIYIPPLLPHRLIRARLPESVDLILDCSTDSHPLTEALSHHHAVRLCDLFRSPSSSKGQPDAISPSQEDLATALSSAATTCLASPPEAAAPIPLTAISSNAAVSDYTSIVDFTCSSSVPARVQPVAPQTLFRSDKSYLLVGCTGGLGQSLTRWMVQNGVRHLILTSRNTKSVGQAWLDELKSMGAAVHLFQLDIADKPALLSMHDHVKKHLPPVAGVANAAMVLSDRLFNDLTVEDLNKVLNPKVAGTAHLDELFSTPSLDFFILFSSLASVVGNRGQANYGAANLFMTSMAASRKSRGLVGSVLDIGMVLGIGYVSQTGIYESTLRKFNYMPISEEKFHVMFTEAVVAGRPEETDTPAEIITGLHRIAESEDETQVQAFWAGNPRFSHYTIREGSGGDSSSGTASAAVPVKKQLADIEDIDEATQIISDGFLAKLGRILQVAVEQINPAQPLINLGVDSLMAVEVRSWFLKEMDVDVPVLRILGGASPLDLCRDAGERYMTPRLAVVAPSTSGSSRPSSSAASRMLEVSQPVSSATSHTGPLTSDEKDSASEVATSDHEEKEEHIEVKQEHIEENCEVGEPMRLSFAQERLWFLRMFLEDHSTYNVTMMYRVKGPTGSILADAFNAVVNRHLALRSTYKQDSETGLPYQRALKESPFRLARTDGDIQSEFQKFQNHSYDLERGESMVAALCSEAPDTHTLILGFHHIVFDGFSSQVFVKDLVTALSGQCLPTLQHQYCDFATRQRNAVEGGAMRGDIAYWKDRFATLPAPVPLLDFCNVSSRQPLTSYIMHGAQRSISASTAGAFKAVVRQSGATPFHGHLSMLRLVLSRFLELDEVCIGITDANRTDTDFLDTIGFFVNLLPLRFDCGEHTSLRSLLQDTRDVSHNALQHSRVPFDVLLDALAVPRSTTESPLFQILMNYKMGSSTRVKTAQLEAELLQFQDARNPYDLVFDIEEQPDGTTFASLQSQSYLYTQDDLRLLLDAYVCLLDSCAKQPTLALDGHQLCQETDTNEALKLARGPQLDLDHSVTISSQIDQTVASTPDGVAVKDHTGQSLTYTQMHQHVQTIASMLASRGVGSGDFVAVYCEPSINSVCYLLAIWRLNAIYVPLDPQNPPARLQLILDDCKPTVLVYDSATEPAISELNLHSTTPITFKDTSDAITSIPDKSDPSSPACALYTSGSTGIPKGIILTHIGLHNQINGVRGQYTLGQETVLQQSSLGFDVSLDQMLQPLVSGGTLVVAPRHLRGDAVELARLMAREQVTYTYATPSEYAALLRYAGSILQEATAWQVAVVGGEALPPHLIRSFHALGTVRQTPAGDRPPLRLINRYGPTEITVSSNCLALDVCDPAVLDIDRVSVGQPLPNYASYILGPDGKPLPIGYVGEIVVAGPGVARGYLQREALNRERFIADSLTTQPELFTRMYRTGDKGRLLPSGEVMYLGRMDGDTQIKLRAFRVELADIAQTILREAQGRLADAVVSVRGTNDENGDSRFLVGFVIPATTYGDEDIQPFLDGLSHRLPLPPYMIPRRIVAVDDFPRNPNGKLDRRVLDKLPLPDTNVISQTLTPAQEVVVRAWTQCLSPASLPTSWSPDTDFFELGGNSLMMIRVQALLCKSFGSQIPLRELFQATSVRGMALRFVPEGQSAPATTIDWEKETALGEMEHREAQNISSSSLPRGQRTEVILTGSSGFLGSALLRALVDDPRVSRIHCIAIRNRAVNVTSDKIVSYSGDLTLPRLGLDERTWDSLGSLASAIIHNGADVSFLKPYHALRRANTLSTRSLACLALRRRIPIHFISTGGVAHFNNTGALLPESLKTTPPPATQDTTTATGLGYISSKWASEVYLESCASTFNLPVTIHRPASIVGQSVPATDLVHTILDLSVKTSSLPSLDGWTGIFDFVDVGDVARGTLDAMQGENVNESSNVRFIHHCSEDGDKIPVAAIGGYLENKFGVALQTVEVETWLQRASGAGLAGVLYDLVAETLGAEASDGEKHSMPVLVKN